MIQLNKRKKIIDIGIGTGTFASLVSSDNNENVVGVDVSGGRDVRKMKSEISQIAIKSRFIY
ncbi:class I SAM-dependent methyltransferase [Bacillus sp. MYb209]|uniref:class I SAM-dependent methyltransferase n=1 Tax=Bacillus sp. MYb209 TaxID=1848605 RepID=UPI0021579F78|nr:class I SAM-dependent methyltransferase [Bacillus sp. MYb209]